jgi:hypothetical protein
MVTPALVVRTLLLNSQLGDQVPELLEVPLLANLLLLILWDHSQQLKVTEALPHPGVLVLLPLEEDLTPDLPL